MKKNYNGFTLSEVLITLGIIGIVAAMTLPSLVGKYQKNVTVAKLQKIYTILNQALARSEVDNEAYRYWSKAFDMGAENYFNLYWKPYLKISHICKTYRDCGYEKTSPFIGSDNSVQGLNMLVMLMAKGSVGGDDNVLLDYILVDINGSTLPNKFGRDVFFFAKTEEQGAKGIMPYCYDRDYNDQTNNCKNDSGMCCAAKIMADGWKIKDDYPW